MAISKWIFLFLQSILLLKSGIAQQVDYYSNIQPILDKHCVSCHSPGEIGAMPLVEYEDVSSYAEMIYFVTSQKIMPPFKANPHFSNLKNQRTISENEIEVIRAWIDQGLTKGIPRKENILKSFQKIEASSKNKLKVCMKESFEQYGIYYNQYQVFCIPTGLKKNRAINSIEFIPGNHSIVRSAEISFTTSDKGRKWDKWDPRYGYFNFGGIRFEPELPNVYSWFPQNSKLEFERDCIVILPAASDLMMHLHYGPSSSEQLDSSCVVLSFASDEEEDVIQNVPLINTAMMNEDFIISAGVRKRISIHIPILTDQLLTSVTPLSHLLCRSWEIYALNKDKSTSPILSIPDWDFNWKERYTLSEPLYLKKGMEIIATAEYDNTIQNPFNPSNPPHPMKEGPHMFDEQLKCYFEIIHLPEINEKDIRFRMTSSIVNGDSTTLNMLIIKPGNFQLLLSDLKNGTQEKLHIIDNNKVGEYTWVWNNQELNSGDYLLQLSKNGEVIDSWYLIKPPSFGSN